ncbi:phage baseplate assembly protein V [Chromohalobacter nigrandesensis]|uniref:phage baseplate assembly protein V n=1 Tax=Chromohalobacter nigrandesensis TaxID=119863 RepID=UPI001FF5ED1F|nr:phage baseplate assembly protein V [Chromohalobacter nigrandesensis]MCK0744106.1 phage baseplate assembly protein V [Chromohalobacter nigrandesensis]
MHNVAELLRLIHNLIRTGTIAEVDHDAARVRVKSGELLTDWLLWIEGRAGTTRDWDPPTVGEQVIVFSPGGDPAAGVVLTGLYRSAHPAPSSDANVIGRWYPDGTRIEYDHAKHRLFIDCVGDIAVKATGTVTVDAKSIHHNQGNPVVTTGHICHFTGNPHGDGSSTVTAGK